MYINTNIARSDRWMFNDDTHYSTVVYECFVVYRIRWFIQCGPK